MVRAKRSRQNHAEHVLSVAKVALEQERSPAAMSDKKTMISRTPMVEQKKRKKKKGFDETPKPFTYKKLNYSAIT
jgi:hypothetical protein